MTKILEKRTILGTCDFIRQLRTFITRPSALGMSDPGVDLLEILEVPDIISFLKFLEGD